MENRPLSISDLVALETVARAAQTGARVRWLTDSGDVGEGTARSIGDERGMFLANGEDVRDAYLRITTIAGFETFEPVSRLAELVKGGGFAIDS
jgi:hypothetical protein